MCFLFCFVFFAFVCSVWFSLRSGFSDVVGKDGGGYLGGRFDLIFVLLNFQRKNITSNRTNHSIEFNEYASRDHFLLIHRYDPLLDIYLVRQYIYFEVRFEPVPTSNSTLRCPSTRRVFLFVFDSTETSNRKYY